MLLLGWECLQERERERDLFKAISAHTTVTTPCTVYDGLENISKEVWNSDEENNGQSFLGVGRAIQLKS